MATATVTVLFTDLVDSTVLMSRVGESAAEGLRREHFSILRTAVDQRGGREVKNLGDGLMVVFTSAADAVAAAVDIQRGLDRRNRRAVEPLLVRVGIALGDADVDDGDYFGVPVVQASRLCAAATGGEVLCTDVVRLLTGSRVDASFEPVGELELKGLSDPVATSRVTWASGDADTAVALPARLAVAVTPRFVGRSVEQERLSAVWKQAASESQCRVVLVSGEPGIGKTTLTARLAAGVQAEGAVVVYGRCDEDLGIPYQPWIEALTQLVAAVPDDVLQPHVANRGAHLARFVPALAGRVGVDVPTGDGGDSERFVLLGCVLDLLERASAEAPVLVVLDDLHWADRQSVQVLKHVATSASQAALLIVGTFRDTDVSDGDPMSDLLAAMHRVDTVERIALRGLDDTDLLELLERTAGHTMDAAGVALRDAVLAETAGNPFFTNEILRHLAETGAIYLDDDTGRWVGDLDIRATGLPVSVTEVIGRRVAGLGADTHRLLTLASVIGRDFDIATLAAAADIDELDVIDRCDTAVTAAVLQPASIVDRYTFTHALIERTLYESMSRARRARAHHTIAEVIETLHGDDPGRVAELAHHWNLAVRPADTDKALHYAQLAGDRALAQLAPDDALRWYTKALELCDGRTSQDDRRRAELLLGVGIAQRQLGMAEHRATLLEVAQHADDLDDVDLLVRATLANTRGWQSNPWQVDDDRVRLIRRAIDRLGDTDRPERAQLLSLLAMELHYHDDAEARLAIAEQAVAVARRVGDRPKLAMTLTTSGWAIRGPDHFHQFVAWAEEAASLADVTRPSAYGVFGFAAETALERGDLARYHHFRDLHEQLAHRYPYADVRYGSHLHRVPPPILAGDLGEAEQLARDALKFGLTNEQNDAISNYGVQHACISTHAGRLHELVPLIDDALRKDPSLTAYRATLTHAVARAGDHRRTLELLDAALDDDFAARRDISWTTTMTNWADAALVVDHHAAAHALHEQLAPFHDRLVTAGVTVFPAISCSLGRLARLLGRYDDAEHWLDHADRFHRGLESPLLVAHSDLARAQLCADRNQPDDAATARRLATAVHELATTNGYGYLATDAADLLTRLPRTATDL